MSEEGEIEELKGSSQAVATTTGTKRGRSDSRLDGGGRVAKKAKSYIDWDRHPASAHCGAPNGREPVFYGDPEELETKRARFNEYTAGASRVGDIIALRRTEPAYDRKKVMEKGQYSNIDGRIFVDREQPALITKVCNDGINVLIRYITTLSGSPDVEKNQKHFVPILVEGSPLGDYSKGCFEDGAWKICISVIPGSGFAWTSKKMYASVELSVPLPHAVERALVGRIVGSLADLEALSMLDIRNRAVTSQDLGPALPAPSKWLCPPAPRWQPSRPLLGDSSLSKSQESRALPSQSGKTYKHKSSRFGHVANQIAQNMKKLNARSNKPKQGEPSKHLRFKSTEEKRERVAK